MKDLINVANVQGICSGKPINVTSNPWRITVKRRCHYTYRHIRETFCVDELFSEIKCYIYYNGVQEVVLNNSTVIWAGYGICIKYKDCENNIKTLIKESSVLFFKPVKMYNEYTIDILNPPGFKVKANRIVVDFPIILHD